MKLLIQNGFLGKRSHLVNPSHLQAEKNSGTHYQFVFGHFQFTVGKTQFFALKIDPCPVLTVKPLKSLRWLDRKKEENKRDYQDSGRHFHSFKTFRKDVRIF
ncbi:MAG: hypothetical protein IH995_10625 [Proteobacteria bacterium]|nr:hypothetical protein [Pseudomonadota bacterium]